MTDYAGEQYTVTHTAEWQGSDLTDDDVDEVVVEIRAADKETVIVAETAMTYDAPQERWEFDWDTVDEEAGTYWAKCTARGGVFGAGEVFEYRRIRLKAKVF